MKYIFIALLFPGLVALLLRLVYRMGVMNGRIRELKRFRRFAERIPPDCRITRQNLEDWKNDTD
jgi:hypothetical protein